MSEYLSTQELAAAYPALFSVSNLKKSRMEFSEVAGPPHFRIGRKVVYTRSDVEAWIASLKATSPKPVIHRPVEKVTRGRPTKADQIARRQAHNGR